MHCDVSLKQRGRKLRIRKCDSQDFCLQSLEKVIKVITGSEAVGVEKWLGECLGEKLFEMFCILSDSGTLMYFLAKV